MSDRFELYVVNNEAFPTELPELDDQQKYQTLVDTVQSVGVSWSTIKLSEQTFSEGLERIDKETNGNGFSPVLPAGRIRFRRGKN